MSRPKISILGAGNVGANTAHLLFHEEIGDVCLYDIAEGKPQGLALDMMHTASIYGKNVQVTGTNDIDDTGDSQVIIITAGHRRTKDMTRDDLLHKNADVITSLVDKIQHTSPQAFIINITNPLDVMAHLAMEISGFPHEKVMGMSGVLDTGRFAFHLAEKLNTSVENVQTAVLGGHGDSMVPLISNCFVNGRPLTSVMEQEHIDDAVEQTRKAGANIIKLMGTSSMYGPATSAVRMTQALLRDEKVTMPCSVYLQGEYGLSDIYISVPVTLSSKGVEQIVELTISEEEMEALHASAEGIRELIKKLNLT